jgi:2-amino-4-hydroxy-6-hydroxymethyldihydropteridine diphosphokinase
MEDILIGLGANLPSAFGPPQATLEAALRALEERGVGIRRRSRWYESMPVPVSDQPWFVNGVALVEPRSEKAGGPGDEPAALLAVLHEVERAFGRERRQRNEARVVDLDLLAYGTRVNVGPTPPLLPHPRLAERAFVLLPLAELLPDWRHPVTGRSVREMIAALPPDQVARPLEG